jgi:hypothetical protein
MTDVPAYRCLSVNSCSAYTMLIATLDRRILQTADEQSFPTLAY